MIAKWRHPPRSFVVAIALLVALIVALLALGNTTASVAACAVLLIWIAAVPGVIYLCGIDQPPLPFAPAIGAYYALFFGVPVFLGPYAYLHADQVLLYRRVLLQPTPPEVILLAAAGVALMFAAFFVAKATILARLPRFRLPTAEANPQFLTVLYAVLLVGSLAFHLIPAMRTVPSIGQFLEPGGYLGLGGFYLLWRAGRLPQWLVWILLLIVLPLELWWRVRYLFVTDLVLLLLFFVFVLWRERQFKLMAVLFVLGAGAAVSYSATSAVRYDSKASVEKIGALIDYIPRVFRAKRQPIPGVHALGEITHIAQFTPLVHRIGQIWVFQSVYERSPDPVPYLEGATYTTLPTSFIPRVLYPEKPEERAGALFGQHYGLTQDDLTSVNIPWMIELLANFGPLGVLWGMTLFGLLLATLDKFFNAPGMSDPEFLIGLTILFRLCYPESNFSVMTGSLLPLVLCLFVYFWGGTALLKRLDTRISNNSKL